MTDLDLISKIFLKVVHSNSFNIETTENELVQRCQDSCIEFIQVNGNGTLSQGSLVSSAVDAMFHFRVLSDEESTDSDAQKESIKKSQLSSYRKSHDVGDRDIKRPLQLPPLIEKLVGTVDTNVRLNSPHLSTRKRVRPDKDEWNTAKQTDIAGQPKENTNRVKATSGSVARVAAAAAAAVLSESEQKGRRKLSMKSYNDEWEEALRWIASWEQSDEGQTGHSQIKYTQNKREKRKQKRDKVESQNSEILQILDKCIDSCIDREGNISFLETNKGGSFTYEIPEQRVQRIENVFKLYPKSI